MAAIRLSLRFGLLPVLLASLGVPQTGAVGPTFFPDDPIWTEPLTHKAGSGSGPTPAHLPTARSRRSASPSDVRCHAVPQSGLSGC